MLAHRSLYKRAKGDIGRAVAEGGGGGFGVELIREMVSVEAGVLLMSCRGPLC